MSIFFYRIDLLNKSLLNKSLKFHAPHSVYFHQNGFLLIDTSEDGEKRLLKISHEGKIAATLKGGSRSPDQPYVFYRLVTDNKDNIYINNVVYNIDDGSTEKSEIQVYSPDLKYIKTIVSHTYNQDERKRLSEEFVMSAAMIPAVEISDDSFYYYHFDAPDMLSLYKTDLNGRSKLKIISFNINYPLCSITGHIPGKIYYSNSKGEIYRIAEDGSKEKIDLEKSQNTHSLYPYSLCYDENRGLIFNELYSQKIMSVKDGTVTDIFDFKEMYKSGYAGNILITDFSYSDGKILTSDKYRGNILEISYPSGNINDIYEGSFPFSEILIRAGYILVLILILLSIAAILRIAGIRSHISRIPGYVRKTAIFSAAFLICGYSVSHLIWEKLQTEISREYESKLLNVAQIASNLISGDNLDKLDSLDDIDSTEFRKLSEQMNIIMDSGHLNSEPGLDMYIYKKLKFVYCVTNKDGFDFLFPYTFYEGYAETESKGTVKINNYSDENGEWLTATSPVKNSRGDISGVIEIGQSLEVTKEKEQANRKTTMRIMFLGWIIFTLIIGISYAAVHLIRTEKSKSTEFSSSRKTSKHNE